VNARIVSVSMGPDRQYKIGLTTRQQGLGSVSWSKEKKVEKPVEKPAAKKPEKKKDK
jgi:DNA-directed RNA polymerase subunit E'/Rpb7